LAIASIALAIVAFNGQDWYLGFRLKVLCEREAGVKVYETADLPSSYDKGPYGRLWDQQMPTGRPDGSWFGRTSDNAYRKITTVTYIVGQKPRDYEQGNTLSRWHVEIYRWPDKKLMGEQITFVHHYSCLLCSAPAPHRACPRDNNDLTFSVFQGRR
jgi:hypothetical protein